MRRSTPSTRKGRKANAPAGLPDDRRQKNPGHAEGGEVSMSIQGGRWRRPGNRDLPCRNNSLQLSRTAAKHFRGSPYIRNARNVLRNGAPRNFSRRICPEPMPGCSRMIKHPPNVVMPFETKRNNAPKRNRSALGTAIRRAIKVHPSEIQSKPRRQPDSGNSLNRMRSRRR